MSGSHILDPRNPFFSFRRNFTKKYVSSQVRLIPDSNRSDLSKEPIKSELSCKNAKKIKNSVTTGPKCQVNYKPPTHLKKLNLFLVTSSIFKVFEYLQDTQNYLEVWMKSLTIFSVVLDLLHNYGSNFAHLLAFTNLVIEFLNDKR